MVGVRGSIPLAPTIPGQHLSIVIAGAFVASADPTSNSHSAIKSRTNHRQRRAIRAKHVRLVPMVFTVAGSIPPARRQGRQRGACGGRVGAAISLSSG
jgi:hypothetical protein